VTKGVLDALHDPPQFAHSFFGDAGPLNCQLNDLWNGKESHGHRHKGHAVPQEERSIVPDDRIKGKSWHAIYRVKSVQ